MSDITYGDLPARMPLWGLLGSTPQIGPLHQGKVPCPVCQRAPAIHIRPSGYNKILESDEKYKVEIRFRPYRNFFIAMLRCFSWVKGTVESLLIMRVSSPHMYSLRVGTVGGGRSGEIRFLLGLVRPCVMMDQASNLGNWTIAWHHVTAFPHSKRAAIACLNA